MSILFIKGWGAEPENRNWLWFRKPKSTMKLYHPQACFWGYVHSLWSFTFHGYFNHLNVPVRNHLFLCAFLLLSHTVLRTGFGNRREPSWIKRWLHFCQLLLPLLHLWHCTAGDDSHSLEGIYSGINFHISEHVLKYHYSEYSNYMHFSFAFLL